MRGGETGSDEDEAEKLAGAKPVIVIASLCLLLLFYARRSTGRTAADRKRVLVFVVQGPEGSLCGSRPRGFATSDHAPKLKLELLFCCGIGSFPLSSFAILLYNFLSYMDAANSLLCSSRHALCVSHTPTSSINLISPPQSSAARFSPRAIQRPTLDRVQIKLPTFCPRHSANCARLGHPIAWIVGRPSPLCDSRW